MDGQGISAEQQEHNDTRPTHLDLFSGILGFALAAQWAGFETVACVEKDEWCQRLILQSGIPVCADIFNFSGRRYRGVNLLTGGFPCQPFSVAGKRTGKEDDRYLWPEMLRVIKESEPDWIVGENVAGLDGMGLDDCISDLEAINYEVAPPLEIPACAVGAQHERNRIWIVANRHCSRQLQPERRICDQWGRFGDSDCNVPYRHSLGRSAPIIHSGATSTGGSPEPARWDWNFSKLIKPFPPTGEPLEALLTPDTCGTPYGLPDGVDRLKGLGNAIVPQVAYVILKAIRELL